MTFDKYMSPETVTVRRANLDALIKAVSEAMSHLENYQKNELKPPVFR